MKPTQVTVHPCAKINLGLYITGKLPNGYHTLETIFLPVTLFDTLRLRRRKRDISFTCDTHSVPANESNLVFKAADKYFHSWSPPDSQRGVSINLKKRIPVGSGLGGGSSDAAYTLIGLQQLFGYPLEGSTIRKLAKELGADVPFFLESRVCLGQGIGEILTPALIYYSGWIVLVWQNFSISTIEVFERGKFNLTNKNKIAKMLQRGKIKNIFSLVSTIGNELESVVFPMYPELEVIKNSLKQEGAGYASLSGSGSTVYGLFSEKDDAVRAFRQLSAHYHAAITRQFLPHI